MPLNSFKMRLNGLFIIGKHDKTINNQNPNHKICNTKSLWTLLGLVWQPTSRGRNLVILSLFGMYDTFLERSRWVLYVSLQALAYGNGPTANPKKRHLGGQNYSGSSGTKKLLKIVNAEMNKEIDETDWGSRWNRRVATNIHLDKK